MAQTTILAAGQTAANATDVLVASGGTARLAIRGAGNVIPRNICLAVVPVIDTVEGPAVAQLDWINPGVQVGPGTWRVKRPDIAAYGVDVTVTSDA